MILRETDTKIKENGSLAFGAKVALESSWDSALTLADPSNMEGSLCIRSLDPA